MKGKVTVLLGTGLLGLLLALPAFSEQMLVQFVNKTTIDPLPVFITTGTCAKPGFKQLAKSTPVNTTVTPNCGFRFNNAYDWTVVFTSTGASYQFCPTCTHTILQGNRLQITINPK